MGLGGGPGGAGRRCTPVTSSWSESEGPGTRSTSVRGQECMCAQLKQRASPPFFHLCVLSWPSTCMVRVILTQFTNSNANFFWKYPHGHTQKLCPTSYQESLSPVTLTHTINHHTIISTIHYHCRLHYICK